MASNRSLQQQLELGLKQALAAIRWERIHDFGPEEDRFPEGRAPVLAERPNIDLAVLAFDHNDALVAAANVLLSRDAPRGVVVKVSDDLNATNVAWQRWNQKRWDGAERWGEHGVDGSADQLLSSTPEPDDLPFMSPYPASVFKLSVAEFVLHEVDQGAMAFEQVRSDLSAMIRVSSNDATRNLLKLLHRQGSIERMNQRLQRRGLGTIQIQDTDPESGERWQVDRITMTSLHTAKLLWSLKNNTPSKVLWRNEDGQPIRSELSKRSRRFLLQLLSEQALNEALSTSNFGAYRSGGKRYGAKHVGVGIPAAVPECWIDAETGTVRFAIDGTALNYGIDVRPFNNNGATRTFSHKTGLTYNFGADAGIVEATDGSGNYSYVVAMFSNLGYRYTDLQFADQKSYPLYGEPSIAYTQEIPRLGHNIDQLMHQLLAKPPATADNDLATTWL